MMRINLVLIGQVCLTLLSCANKNVSTEKVFPLRTEILDNSFSNYENFFPIVSMDFTQKGIKDKLHILYVCFDPEVNDSICFPKGDDKDHFSLDIAKNGKLKPSFNHKALIVGKNFQKFFEIAKNIYEKAKAHPIVITKSINVSDTPEWWQSDETPFNSKGSKYQFVCQMLMDDLSDDDCKMFVFHDNFEKKIRIIYQRD